MKRRRGGRFRGIVTGMVAVTGLGFPISHGKCPSYAVYEKDVFCHKPAGVRNRKILELIEGTEEGEEIFCIHLTMQQIYIANSQPKDPKVGQASKISSRQPRRVDVGETGKAPIAVMTEVFIVLNRVAVVVNTLAQLDNLDCESFVIVCLMCKLHSLNPLFPLIRIRNMV